METWQDSNVTDPSFLLLDYPGYGDNGAAVGSRCWVYYPPKKKTWWVELEELQKLDD